MKKLFTVCLLVVGISPVFADPLVPVSVADQFKAALVNDMTFVYAHTSHNEDKGYFLTSLLQFGKYEGEYILAADFGGVASSGQAISIHKTYGIHVHAVPFILKNVPMNPSLANFLKYVEITPRYSFDEDARHGVLSYMVGAKVSY